jgi:hypothetical protein
MDSQDEVSWSVVAPRRKHQTSKSTVADKKPLLKTPCSPAAVSAAATPKKPLVPISAPTTTTAAVPPTVAPSNQQLPPPVNVWVARQQQQQEECGESKSSVEEEEEEMATQTLLDEAVECSQGRFDSKEEVQQDMARTECYLSDVVCVALRNPLRPDHVFWAGMVSAALAWNRGEQVPFLNPATINSVEFYGLVWAVHAQGPFFCWYDNWGGPIPFGTFFDERTALALATKNNNDYYVLLDPLVLAATLYQRAETVSVQPPPPSPFRISLNCSEPFETLSDMSGCLDLISLSNELACKGYPFYPASPLNLSQFATVHLVFHHPVDPQGLSMSIATESNEWIRVDGHVMDQNCLFPLTGQPMFHPLENAPKKRSRRRVFPKIHDTQEFPPLKN